jgi:hypothetical protein
MLEMRRWVCLTAEDVREGRWARVFRFGRGGIVAEFLERGRGGVGIKILEGVTCECTIQDFVWFLRLFSGEAGGFYYEGSVVRAVNTVHEQYIIVGMCVLDAFAGDVCFSWEVHNGITAIAGLTERLI